MTTKEITQRNYIATVRRGQITAETTAKQFIQKLQEELKELIDSLSDDVTAPFDIKELADISLVCDRAMGMVILLPIVSIMFSCFIIFKSII